jgi:signal transduction histidine kinase
MESNQNKIQSTIKPLSPLVNETISKLSAISKNLVPTSLKSLGLLQTINQLIEIFESNQTANISFTTNYSKCVGIEIELQLYRIVQEAIHNAIKHANATQIDVKLHISKTELSLLISDNGRGMEVNNSKSTAGNGLKSLKNRALIIGGEFNIHSKAGKGTHLQFEIPLNA